MTRTPARQTHLRRVKPPPPAPGNAGDRVPVACLLFFLVMWGVLAIAPSYREDWLLENLPVFIAVPIAVATYRRFRFSDRAYVQLTLFLVLHSVGAHYTYSEVPLGAWVSDALGWSRNHYDRFVHLAFGFLMLRPALELAFPRERDTARVRPLVLAVASVAALSVFYEIVEWLTAAMVDPQAGTAFLGTQGDEWDAQKDMSLATGGAVLAAVIEGLSRRVPRFAARDGGPEGARSSAAGGRQR